MPHVDLVAGNNTTVTLHFKDDDTGISIDLTGFTITLRYSLNGGTAVERSMTIQTPQATSTKTGKADYKFIDGELVAGTISIAGDAVDGSSNDFSKLDPVTLTIRAKL